MHFVAAFNQLVNQAHRADFGAAATHIQLFNRERNSHECAAGMFRDSEVAKHTAARLTRTRPFAAGTM
jgi:hypothetical protein